MRPGNSPEKVIVQNEELLTASAALRLLEETSNGGRNDAREVAAQADTLQQAYYEYRIAVDNGPGPVFTEVSIDRAALQAGLVFSNARLRDQREENGFLRNREANRRIRREQAQVKRMQNWLGKLSAAQ